MQELEKANAFVVALDVARSWFRYHRLFADLLQLELRRTASGEIAALHHTAAQWYAGYGYPVEAIRHAQAAQDWGLAVRLLGDHWPGLQLGGQAATVHAMLAGFPAGAARRMLSSRRSPRPMSWLGDHWRRRSGTWAWRRGGRRRCQRAAGASCWCCSGWFGCWWPGSAGTCRRWPTRRNGCRL